MPSPILPWADELHGGSVRRGVPSHDVVLLEDQQRTRRLDLIIGLSRHAGLRRSVERFAEARGRCRTGGSGSVPVA